MATEQKPFAKEGKGCANCLNYPAINENFIRTGILTTQIRVFVI